MGRYMIFAGWRFCPKGGMADLAYDTDDLDAVYHWLGASRHDWTEVFDRVEGVVIHERADRVSA